LSAGAEAQSWVTTDSERNVINAMELAVLSDNRARKCIYPFIKISDCEGLGVQRNLVKEDVDLPAGVPDGQKLRFKGLGHASDVFQGLSGDLLITIKVKPHD